MKSKNLQLLLAAMLCCNSLSGQVISPEAPSITATQVSIVFTAPVGTAVGSFSLESSDTLLANDWDEEPNAAFSSLGGSSFSVTVPRPTGPTASKRFYQILLGGEIIISFDSAVFAEGTTAGLPISFATPFTGLLPYSILRSDGTSETGTLNLAGATSASIPFSVADDGQPSGRRFATLNLDPAVGNSFTQTFEIDDNDAIWDGIFTDEDGAELTFCIEETNVGSIKLLSLVNTDSSNFFPLGKGGAIINSTFNDTTLLVQLFSNTRLGSESAFGFPSYYTLDLAGTVRAGSDGLFFEGQNLGDATLTHVVGRRNSIVSPPTDSFDLAASNDSLATASALGALPGTIAQNGLTIDGTPDFYRFTSNSGDQVTVRIEFFHADGDLDMRTYNSADAIINTSQGTVNFEEYTFTSTGGTNTVEVYGFQSAENPYRLIISTEELPPPTTGEHLSTVTQGRFAIIKRPLPPEDGKAALLPATN